MYVFFERIIKTNFIYHLQRVERVFSSFTQAKFLTPNTPNMRLVEAHETFRSTNLTSGGNIVLNYSSSSKM